MRMYDIHNNNQNKDTVKYELDKEIKSTKRESDRLLYLIVGYGSSGGSHKIKNYVIEYLDLYIKSGLIKDYIIGSDIDIFNSKYQAFKGREKLPENVKKERNPGAIIVLV